MSEGKITPNLELSEQERDWLVKLVQTELGNLRQEIHHTNTYEYKDQLKEREEMVRQLVKKLQGEQISI